MKKTLFFLFLLTIFACGTKKKNEIHSGHAAKTKIYTKIPTLQERKAYYQKNFPNVEIVHNRSTSNRAREKSHQQIALAKELVLVYANDDTNKIFFNICDVKADRLGSIYVAEFSRSGTHIKKFDSKGNYLLTIGRSGGGPGELTGPLQIHIQGDTLFVYDTMAGRITLFDLSGSYQNSIPLQMDMLTSSGYDFYRDNKSNFFYLSYYDEKDETVIHSFDSLGRKSASFGNGLIMKEPLTFQDFELRIKNSPGRIFVAGNKLFFSQFNPYEIRVYSLNGDLQQVIFREADFMPRDAIKILPGGEHEMGLPTTSTMVRVKNGFILNFVLVVPDVQKDYGTVVDLFDPKGYLLASATLSENIWFSDLQPNGMLYGRRLSFDGSAGESIVCYKIRVKNLF